MTYAEATYLETAAAATDTVRPVRPGTDCLVAVVDWPATVESVQRVCRAAGVEPAQIDLLRGPHGLRRLGASGTQAGLRATLRRWYQALGPERALLERYRRELRMGRTLVVARSVSRASAQRLCAGLAAHGGRGLQHYGRFAVTYLAP